MGPAETLAAAIFTPALVGAATLLLPQRWTPARVGLALLGPAAALAILLAYLSSFGLAAGTVGGPWMPELRMDFYLRCDGLAAFFALLVASFGVLVVLYARAYFGPAPDDLYRFYPTLGLFTTAMLGLVLSDSFMLLMLFWELTSVSSFLLIGWERDDPAAVKKAMAAFVTTGTAGLALLGGLILLGASGGAWTFSGAEVWAATSPGGDWITWAFLLVFVGAAAKSAQWPLHFWLPGAMAAPTPVSAYLHSATMVKAGVYLIARAWPTFSPVLPAGLWPTILISFGTATMLLGAYVALRRTDLKQIFAYTTVSQLGLLMAAYGLGGIAYKGEANLLWPVTQVLNHALYKAPLFMLAGAIGHVAHTREVPELHGLARRGGSLGLMAVLMLVAAYALAAGPGTLSFTGKELFFYQVWHGFEATGHPLFWLLIPAGVAVGALNVAVAVRLGRAFFAAPVDPLRDDERRPVMPDYATDDDGHASHLPHGAPRHDAGVAHVHAPGHHDDADHHDTRFWSALLWVPAAVLIGLQLLGGVAPPVFDRLFGGAETHRLYFNDLPSLWYAVTHPGVPLLMSVVGYALGVALAFSDLLRPTVRDVHDGIFPAYYKLAVNGGNAAFRLIQTGRARTYVAAMLGLIVACVGWATWRSGAPLAPPGGLVIEPLYDPAGPDLLAGGLLAALVCSAAVLLTVVRDRASRILVLGVVGFGVTAVYYLYHAPDLALTQISIEIVSLILFLFVLTLLPKEVPDARSATLGRWALGAAVGVTMGWLTLSGGTADRPPFGVTSADGTPIASLGDYFLRNSYKGVDAAAVDPASVGAGVVDRGAAHLSSFGSGKDAKASYAEGEGNGEAYAAADHPAASAPAAVLHKGGGGANAVNVTLVDFRGFDTLGEVVVLGLAAMGVWVLLRVPPSARRTGGDDDGIPTDRERVASDAEHAGFSGDYSTSILRTACGLLVPLSLAFAAYVFLKGHQSPGGGFVGGLIAAVALIVQRMTFGGGALRRVLPVKERTLIAVGLLLAGGTGAAALLAGLPFLTSNNGYLPLPGTTPFHWATVAVFDLGVALVVVGVVVGMIDALACEFEAAGRVSDRAEASAAPARPVGSVGVYAANGNTNGSAKPARTTTAGVTT